uniref:Protein MTSS 1-like n=1 Tax=Gadus morhua TaxID=8049 RepID=A0A8C5AJG6_GADMO
MEAVIEKECSALGGLFQTVIGDMKSSYPIWEDFISKAGKLQSQLRATVFAAAAFLDAFQKVADLATNSRGGTRDIGSALTRMCMRHRGIETKLKQFSMTFADCLINPLQEQMEEWKRGVATLDKDHAKEYKRARNEIKKKSSDTLKLQKKAKKGRGDFQPQLDSAMQDVSDKYILLEETEKQALRRALIEERQRFCCFVAMLRPVVDEEISMLGEVTHLQTISDDLKALTSDPHTLPPASEQVIMDLKGSDYHWSFQTPPSSPNATMSRKSSMCSSLNSVNSTDSRGSSSGSHSHSPSSSSSSSSSTSSSHNLLHNNHHTNNNHHHHHHRYRSSTLPLQAPPRLSSISSHDSGFTSSSHDQYAPSKSPSPMLAEAKVSRGARFGAFPLLPPSPSTSSTSSASSSTTTCPSRSWLRPTSALLPDFPSYCTLSSSMLPSSRVPSWKDWAKPGPYDQPMVNTLRRRKDKDHPLGPVDPNAEGQRTSAPATPAGALEAHDELALALSRGLQLDAQRSSRDSMQCSSGYSTQSTTPCCSEDTIPSQGSRTQGPQIITPGTATIRRTPSTKPAVRRCGSVPGTGPIHIRTPMVPALIPTVPDLPRLSPGRGGGEEAAAAAAAQASGDLGSPPPGGRPGEGAREEWDGEELMEGGAEEGGSMLAAIRKGVKLKRTPTDDRSAPRMA